MKSQSKANILNKYWIWEPVRNFTVAALIVSYIVIAILVETREFNRYYYIIPFFVAVIANILDIWVRNVNEEPEDIKKIVFLMTIISIVLLSICGYILINKTFAAGNLVWTTYFIVFMIADAFKDKIIKRYKIAGFFFRDTPPLFSKQFFKESERHQIAFAFVGVFILLCLVAASILAFVMG